MPRCRLLLPLPVLALLLLTVSCARHETAVESGTRDQILHLGNKDEPADLDPQYEQRRHHRLSPEFSV